jgi:hypothetical protein
MFRLLTLLLLLPSGCSLIYKHSYQGRSFAIYSDRKSEFLAEVGKKVTRIYEGYQKLFEIPETRLGLSTLVLQGDDSAILDYGYSPTLLGYYVPFFNYISVDTASVSTQSEEMLDQVLLHEIAHHFIATEFPRASQECWLNEGLAGSLEVTLFKEDHFEHPLFNPILFQIAQRTAYSSPDSVNLQRLLDMGWAEFHQNEEKERNYALAWSIVYFLLERTLPAEMPLGERIEVLYTMDRARISKLEASWVTFLRGFDMARHLLTLARSNAPERGLTSLWAARQLGNLRSLDDLAVLEGLAGLFETSDPAKRAVAFLSFVRVLERNPNSFFLSEKRVGDGLKRLDEALESPLEPLPLREALTIALGESIKTRKHWLPRLISLLDREEGDVRAAAATSLSRMALKPTIANPWFWRNAPSQARAEEVAEWRQWLENEDAKSSFQ